MFHNKISYSPRQPLLYLAEGRGSGWELWLPGLVGASDHVGRTRVSGFPLGLCCRFFRRPGVTGVMGAASVLGVSVLGVSLVFRVPWVSLVPWVPGVPWVRQVAGVRWVFQVSQVLLLSRVSRVLLVSWCQWCHGCHY